MAANKSPEKEAPAKKTPAKKTPANKTPANKTPADKGAKKTPTRGKRKPAAAKSKGLSPADLLGEPPADVLGLVSAIETDGGKVLAPYRDPLEGKWVVLAALPLDRVQLTSFQRDVSESHVDKLVDAIKRTGRFLDPLICVRGEDGKYLTPNGGHRLTALTRMGATSITALVLPEPELKYKILALNVEKAHVLKERALEVVRMVRSLVELGGKESDYALDLEDPALATLGACYEERARFAGSAYHPILKRIDTFLDLPLDDALVERHRRAGRLLEVEDKVAAIIKALKAKGFDSPYLRNFVVARLNPLGPTRRGKKSEEALDPKVFDEKIDKMLEKAQKFDVDKVDEGAVARASG
jgi:ParB family chromosome partitioning protein